MGLWRSPHDTEAPDHSKEHALLLAIALSLLAFLVQVVGSWYSGSLALLSDSAHLFTDLCSLILSLLAVRFSQRSTDHQRSFGLHRLEVLAAFLNGILLFGVGLLLVKEGIERFREPHEVKSGVLLAVATFGLLANVLSGLILARSLGGHVHHHGHDHSHEDTHDHDHGHGCNHDHKPASSQAQDDQHDHHKDRNIRSAMMHVWSDALSSVAVIIGAVVIHYTGWAWVDSALAILITGLIFRWSIRVLRDSGHVLLEGTPAHLDPHQVMEEVRKADPRVRSVEDLHVWEITSKMYAATLEVHVDTDSLAAAEEIRKKVSHTLHEKYGIAHPVISMQPWR